MWREQRRQTRAAKPAALATQVRTRIFMVNISDWEKIGKDHGEIFSEISPAATLLEVNRRVSPELLVEVEAEAIVSQP